MEDFKVISGAEIVARGITRVDGSLPEIGLKDVTPNGSWLEQKQVQAALEARKHLIEVERIEKNGSISHAVWQDDLQLAEVTQKVGGHWQYLGHNMEKKLYLRPEEALFLMEINALLLKHNDVTVSFQKAYPLLLSTSQAFIQYSVYSSLSRIGYKVFRHKKIKVNNDKNNLNGKNVVSDDIKVEKSENIDSPKDNETSNAKHSDCEFIESSNNVDSELTAKTENNDKAEEIIPIETVNVSDISENASANDDSKEIDSVESQNMEVCESNAEDNNETNENNQLQASEVPSSNNTKSVTDENPIDMETNEACNESPKKNTQEVSLSEDANVAAATHEVNGVVNEVPNENFEKETSMEICTDPSTTASETDLQNKEGITENTDLSNNHDPNNAIATATANVLTTNEKRNNHLEYSISTKLTKLTNRKQKPSDSKTIIEYFENIPDLYKKQVVSVNVPDQNLIPKNVFVNNTSYLLNLQNIKKRSIRSVSTESANYTSADEVNGVNIRRIRSSSASEFPQNQNVFMNTRIHRQVYIRPEGFWRPQNNLNYYQFNMFFQRHSFPNMFFQTRMQYLPRPNAFLRSFPYPSNLNPNVHSNDRKRMRHGRTAHLQTIKNMAVRLKQMLLSNNNDIRNLQALQSLIHTYNMRYKARLRLTQNFDIVNEEKIIETIELDDDEESKSKKSRLDNDSGDVFDENLYRLRQLAIRLRDLEAKDKATTSHKRALSKAVKTFNKSFNADVYFNEETYEIIDRRFITLESSSESDCVVEEQPTVKKKRKLRNPFNILKRRSEREKSQNNPGTSKDKNASETNKIEAANTEVDENKYNKQIVEIFNEKWLPNEEDFGRAEVVPKKFMNLRLLESGKEQYLYEFMNDSPQECKNWLEAKILFLKHLEDTHLAFENERARLLADADLNTGLRPLIDSEDTKSGLEKLRIIKNNKEKDPECSLTIDFDVYNRNVHNFKKTNPPKPHFRIICIGESAGLPSATEVTALHSQYDDNIPIVFAVVSLGSISYLRINPTDLAVYTPRQEDIV